MIAMIVKSSRLNTGILRHANGMFPQWACIELSDIRVLNHNHTQSVAKVIIVIIIFNHKSMNTTEEPFVWENLF